MNDKHLPLCNLRYWAALTLASIAGANIGDACSHVLGLGHVRGLPVLLALFAGVLWAERRSRTETEAFYWTAILLVRTAATNVGDLATHDLRIPPPPFILAMAALLALLVAAAGNGTRSAGREALPQANAVHWIAMLCAGTLGTVLGDYCADIASLGSSTAAWAVVWAVAVVAAANGGAATVGAYWATVAVVRTAGTNGGDYLVAPDGLNLGLLAAAAASVAALALLVALWPQAAARPAHHHPPAGA